MVAQWVRDFTAVLIVMRANKKELPDFELGEMPTPDDLKAALRLAREIDPRVHHIEHHRNYGDPMAKSVIRVRLGELDTDPPPFLERFPMPLLPVPPP